MPGAAERRRFDRHIFSQIYFTLKNSSLFNSFALSNSFQFSLCQVLLNGGVFIDTFEMVTLLSHMFVKFTMR